MPSPTSSVRSANAKGKCAVMRNKSQRSIIEKKKGEVPRARHLDLQPPSSPWRDSGSLPQ